MEVSKFKKINLKNQAGNVYVKVRCVYVCVHVRACVYTQSLLQLLLTIIHFSLVTQGASRFNLTIAPSTPFYSTTEQRTQLDWYARHNAQTLHTGRELIRVAMVVTTPKTHSRMTWLSKYAWEVCGSQAVITHERSGAPISVFALREIWQAVNMNTQTQSSKLIK